MGDYFEDGSTSSTTTWYRWACTSTTTTATTIIDPVWVGWVTESTSTVTTTAGYYPRREVRWAEPTPAELAAREAERQRMNEVQQRLCAEAKAAAEKATALLLSLLDARQRERYTRDGWFIVHGKHHRYRIRRGRIGNVDVIERDGRVIHSLCAHPADSSLPDEDVMLAQKLALEANEKAFVRVANVHHRRCEEFNLPMMH